MQKKKKRFVKCIGKVLRLIKNVKSDFQSFVLEISHWTMLHGQVPGEVYSDQIKTLVGR